MLMQPQCTLLHEHSCLLYFDPLRVSMKGIKGDFFPLCNEQLINTSNRKNSVFLHCFIPELFPFKILTPLKGPLRVSDPDQKQSQTSSWPKDSVCQVSTSYVNPFSSYRADGRTDRRTDGQTDGRTDGHTDNLRNIL